jgi:hypothetical protein
MPWGVTLPEDAARWEVSHALNTKLRVQKQRRHAWVTGWMAARVRGEDTPSEPESTDEEEEEEGEVTPLSLSPPHETIPPLGDIFSRQEGVTVNVHRSKWTWTEADLSVSLPLQPRLVLVSPFSQGSSIAPMLMETSHLPRISQVLPCASSSGGMEPVPKKARLGAFPWVSSRFVCGVACYLRGSCFSCFHP